MRELIFHLEALTDIWTGGIKQSHDKLHLTGIRGSIRWWYEALVRGLDGYACDPTEEDKRCSFNLKEFYILKKKGKNFQEILDDMICPACQMFGCNNWSAKFILRINKIDKFITNQIKKGDKYTLEFIENKKITDFEQNLLNGTIKLIVDYGAIGGKTALKPSDIKNKNCERYSWIKHIDFGLLKFQDGTNYPKFKISNIDNRIKENKPDWANLKYFWFVKGAYLDRKDINKLLNRLNSDPSEYDNNKATESDVFLGGYITRRNGQKTIPPRLKTDVDKRKTRSSCESKKIFSFHGFVHYDGNDCVKRGITPRCFGYTRNAKEQDYIFNQIQNILKTKKIEIKKGLEVLDEL